MATIEIAGKNPIDLALEQLSKVSSTDMKQVTLLVDAARGKNYASSFIQLHRQYAAAMAANDKQKTAIIADAITGLNLARTYQTAQDNNQDSVPVLTYESFRLNSLNVAKNYFESQPIKIAGLATNGDSMHKAFNDLQKGANVSQERVNDHLVPLYNAVKGMPFEEQMRALAARQHKLYRRSEAYNSGTLTPEQQMMYLLNRAHAYDNPKGISIQEPTPSQVMGKVDRLYDKYLAEAKKLGVTPVVIAGVASASSPAPVPAAPAAPAPEAPVTGTGTGGGAVRMAEPMNQGNDEPAVANPAPRPRKLLPSIDKEVQFALEKILMAAGDNAAGQDTGKGNRADMQKAGVTAKDMDGIRGTHTNAAIQWFKDKHTELKGKSDKEVFSQIKVAAAALGTTPPSAAQAVDGAAKGTEVSANPMAGLQAIAAQLKDATGNPLSDTAVNLKAVAISVFPLAAKADDATIKTGIIERIKDTLVKNGVTETLAQQAVQGITIDDNFVARGELIRRIETAAKLSNADDVFDQRDQALLDNQSAITQIAKAINNGSIQVVASAASPGTTPQPSPSGNTQGR